MAEYIKRSEAIKALGEEPMVWTDDDSLIQEYADWVKHVEEIKAIPAADVAPVVHGKWIGRPICGNSNCRCSNCGSWFNIHANMKGMITQKYCPNCGAKMDLEG